MRPNDDLSCKPCYAPGLALTELRALTTTDAQLHVRKHFDPHLDHRTLL